MSELIDRLEDCDIWLSDGGTPKDRDVLREAIVRIAELEAKLVDSAKRYILDVDKAEATSRQLCADLDEAQKVVEARDDQAAIDKDFIRQYQEQVEELQTENKELKSRIYELESGNIRLVFPESPANMTGE